jgi:hypothetical protein
MPSWTLGDLMSRATTRIGRRSDITLSDASFYVNMAYQEIAASEPSALMETLTVSSTTSGENRVELPADYMEMRTLSWYTTGESSAQTLRRMSVEHIDAQGPGTLGRPDRYALYNNWLELWPSPDSAYSLQMRYVAYPSDMTATTAVPSLATEWRPAVLYLAEALLHEHVGNAVEGAYARTNYVGYVSQLRNVEARRQAAGGMRASLPLRRSRYGGSDTGESW